MEYYHNLIAEKSFKTIQDLRKKYEAKKEETDIDIYLPHYSNIGFPLEEIKNNNQSVEGFLVPIPEILLILKIFVFKQRAGTVRDRKDLIDIFSLLKEEIIDWDKYKKIIKKHQLKHLNQELKELVASASAIEELNLLNHKISKLKKQILKNL